MKKKNFQDIRIDLIVFDSEDIISTSGEPEGIYDLDDSDWDALG